MFAKSYVKRKKSFKSHDIHIEFNTLNQLVYVKNISPGYFTFKELKITIKKS